MPHAIAFVRQAAPLTIEPLRRVIVLSCGLALIAAGAAFPF